MGILKFKGGLHFWGDQLFVKINLRGPPEWRSGLMHCIAIPGSVTDGHDWETHEAAHNWPSIVQVRRVFGRPRFPCPVML